MIRSIHSALLLSVLVITTLENTLNPAYSALAQTPVVVATCDLNLPIQNRLGMASEQARSALEQSHSEEALQSLQAALAIAAQLQNPRLQADFLQQWLLDANEGYPTTRWQRLTQNLDQQAQSAQLQATLGQFSQTANQLTPAYSYVKTRSLAAIARYSITLDPGENQQARQALEQARQAATSIRGEVFTASALIDVAEAYALMDDTTSALVVLTQVGGAVEQIPPNTSEPLKWFILQRMATTYAQIGYFTNAQAIADRLPDQYEIQSIALRGIVEGMIIWRTDGHFTQAEASAQSIPAITQRIQAFEALAIAYYNINQPAKAEQWVSQARQLAESANGLPNPEFTYRNLVETYLQLGQRDEALQLTQTALRSSRQEVTKSVLVAFSQAGQHDVVESWLSEQLSYVETVPDSSEQRFHLQDMLQVAIATQQFEWVGKEWNRIAAIDYGPQDAQVVEIATAYAATGQYTQAAQWAQQLPLDNRPVLRVRLLAAIALKAHQAGQTSWANDLLQQTLQSVDSLTAAYQRQFPEDLTEGPRAKPSALTALAVVYSQTGQNDLMRQLLQQVSQLDESIINPTLGGPVDQPFAVFMDAQQYVGALQLAQATPNSDARESRLQTSATALVQQNRFDLALPVVDQLVEPSHKTQLLLAIAQRYGDLQQVNAALPILAQAFQFAQTIPGEESQVDRFGVDGLTILDRTDDRGSLLEAIALQYAQFGQGDRARQVADRLQEARLRQQVMQSIQCVMRSNVAR
ncbi:MULTISPECIES: tetratricopeptide repeat protein [unclassified Leptolyngbya]|uniref:tetratricopeptide repeat protein n=1 Tax=unclassified Leptolyngbya TaxID=2650499 RepID=UPI0016863357|nr:MULTISPECIES: tetratricopeptide repeat protein [unclassified Leptolyngbya]MBD1913458.1 tetratricopeptide repeat protein [Leptolyngbya sp. FACHB-8]MBD2156321.1 tetratricopeptide repeat protein [Leptolyngbya sp. FACHB-16]